MNYGPKTVPCADDKSHRIVVRKLYLTVGNYERQLSIKLLTKVCSRFDCSSVDNELITAKLY